MQLKTDWAVCKITAGPRQHSDSWFPVPWDSWPYFTVWWLWKPSELLTAWAAATYRPSMDWRDNTDSNSFYIAAYLFTATEIFFTAPLPSNSHLFLFNYSDFQPSCHIVPSLRVVVLSSLQAYHHSFFSEEHACHICYHPQEWHLNIVLAQTLLLPISMAYSPDSLWGGSCAAVHTHCSLLWAEYLIVPS
jgi:hypothetical protein